MKQSVTGALFLLLFVSLSSLAQPTTPRWTAQQATEWYAKQPWLCGFNYIPANAINYTAMWDKTSFSPDLIQEELALAAKTGFNCVRVVLQHAVYADDPVYFKKTFAQFLTICQRNNIRVMPTFFDDCVFGTVMNPQIGKQPEPLVGWYAWAWYAGAYHGG